MDYEDIDKIINDWAEKHSLSIRTSDRGEEIRTLIRERLDNEGRLVEGVSIDIGPLHEGKIQIWAHHYRKSVVRPKRKYPMIETVHEKTIEVSKDELPSVLEDTYNQINVWSPATS